MKQGSNHSSCFLSKKNVIEFRFSLSQRTGSIHHKLISGVSTPCCSQGTSKVASQLFFCPLANTFVRSVEMQLAAKKETKYKTENVITIIEMKGRTLNDVTLRFKKPRLHVTSEQQPICTKL